MRWLPIALAMLPLAGCIHTAANEFADCEHSARRAFPSSMQRPAYLDDIRVCMAMNGFAYKVSARTCAGNPNEANHSCYVPNQGFEHFLYQHGLGSVVE